MGTNFHAIVDHQLSQENIVKLDVLLHAEWQRPASPLISVPLMPGRTAWKWELLTSSLSAEHELEYEGYLEFVAPVDISGTAFKHALDIGSAIRWSTFLNDINTQQILCRAVRKIAQIAKAHTIIYLPDSIASCEPSDLLHAGEDIEIVLTTLFKIWGPPALSFAHLKQSWFKNQDSCLYFVERTNKGNGEQRDRLG